MRAINAQPEIDLTVFFLSGQSTETYYDPGFGTKIMWDVPLTDGYTHEFLPSRTASGEFSILNPKVSISSVKQALERTPWDAVWIHGYNNLALLYIIVFCRLRKLPLFFRGESNLTSTPSGFFKDLFIRQLIKGAQALLWVSSDNKRYYEHFGAKKSQLFFAPYAVDNHFFQLHATPTNDGDPIGKCSILFASKFIPRKHAPLLVKAFAELDPNVRQQAELNLIGDGEDKREIQAIIKNHGLGDQVKLLGFKNQTELPEYMAACDVFVLPSEREPFGLVINEVMNFAKAIITTNEVGAARDLVTNGDNGWVIPAGDSTALNIALSEAILDPERLTEMGKRSLSKINKWSYQEDIQGLLAALEAI